MTTKTTMGFCGLVLTMSVAACNSEGRELQQRQLAALEEAQKAQAERLEAERRHAELDSFARQYTQQAGVQIMNAVGGGQDLITRYGEWRYDEATTELEIPIAVAFNGQFVRANAYSVTGLLTVRTDGSKARFARSSANENYQTMETTRDLVQLLENVSKASEQ